MVALERMRPRDRGTIVNVGSALASSASRCRPRTARRSSPAGGSSSRRVRSCSTPAARSGCRWCTSPPSTRRSSTGARPPWTIIRSRYRRSTNRRSRRSTSCGSRSTAGGRRSSDRGTRCSSSPAGCSRASATTTPRSAHGTPSSPTRPISPDRPVNLRQPADPEDDAGAHGIFDDQAGGALDPSFLKSLPDTGRTFVAAAVAEARDRSRRLTGSVR